jgi:hypothetical protein
MLGNETVSGAGHNNLAYFRTTAVFPKLAPAMYGKMSVPLSHRKREPEAFS